MCGCIVLRPLRTSRARRNSFKTPSFEIVAFGKMLGTEHLYKKQDHTWLAPSDVSTRVTGLRVQNVYRWLHSGLGVEEVSATQVLRDIAGMLTCSASGTCYAYLVGRLCYVASVRNPCGCFKTQNMTTMFKDFTGRRSEVIESSYYSSCTRTISARWYLRCYCYCCAAC